MKTKPRIIFRTILSMWIGFAAAGCVTVKSETHVFDKRNLSKPLIQKTSQNVLSPVYAPLAEWLVDRFQLVNQNGIGIDLGSGSGNLIIELAQRTPAMHWINADIEPKNFVLFFEKAKTAGVANRVSAQWADATHMPYRDNYADIVVSRGSFPFWGDLKAGFSEIQRILKPGGIAYIGRGFSENLPVEVARTIRDQQQKNKGFPKYNVDETESEITRIMNELGISSFQIHRPKPPGSEGVNYGIWVEWHKEK